ncbi:MAG TPA: NAD(P)/FAD-dependent oxidoreductase [Longimicrobiales bacterium]|nr:NAD(P)/FAD-dependent oxidoreductase [Longimicrobiales bacterium]
MTDTVFDAVVVGGGPAGLSAALWLARYRRTTLVLDDEQPRNEFAWAVHGYPGIPDPHPAELGDQLKEQAADAGARFHHCRVAAVKGRKGAFEVRDEAGLATRARRVIMAYGRTDQLPDVPGLLELYGRSVFHCPDCDGPDMLDRDVGIIGHDQGAATLALLLRTWARSTTLLTDGLDPDLEPAARDALICCRASASSSPLCWRSLRRLIT